MKRESRNLIKNIIKGYLSRWGEIEEITIFTKNSEREDIVTYSGSVLKLQCPDCLMIDETREVMNLEAAKVLKFNERKLFIFTDAVMKYSR